MSTEENTEPSHEYYKFDMAPPKVNFPTDTFHAQETQISNNNLNTFSNFLLKDSCAVGERDKIRFSGLSDTFEENPDEKRKNSNCSGTSSFPTDDSITNALRTIPVTSPHTLFIQSSLEKNEIISQSTQNDATPTQNASVLSCLLKSHSRTFSAMRTISSAERRSADRLKIDGTLQFPSSLIPETPIKNNSLNQELLINENSQHLSENEKAEQDFSNTIPQISPQSGLPISQISSKLTVTPIPPLHEVEKENKFRPKDKSSTLTKLPLLPVFVSSKGNNSQKIPKISNSPEEILRGIDNGALEQRYVKQLKTRGIQARLFDFAQPDSRPNKENFQLIDKDVGFDLREKNETKRNLKKESKNQSEGKAELIPKPSILLDLPSTPLTRHLNQNESKTFTSPRSSCFDFKPNDLVWVKWRYDMFLVGKLESKSSSTRNLWTYKFLFQNKLSIPHFVIPSESIPFSCLRKGDLIANILSKSKFKYKNGIFEKWHEKSGGSDVVQVVIDGKRQSIKLKSIAIHRNLFLELKKNIIQPGNEPNANSIIEERSFELSDELTSQSRRNKCRTVKSVKVILSGSADKKSVKDKLKKLGLELVDNVNRAEILISEGSKRTAKYLSALILGIPIVTTAWMNTGLTVPIQNTGGLQKVLAGTKVMLMGDKKFLKDWQVIVGCLGASISNSKPDVTLIQNEKFKEKLKTTQSKKIALLASELAEMIVNRNFELLFPS
jgi:hypothetical protein